MILALEKKKIKHTGLLPAFLAGALAVSAFPVINMAFRTDLFVSQDLPPIDILLSQWKLGYSRHFPLFSVHIRGLYPLPY